MKKIFLPAILLLLFFAGLFMQGCYREKDYDPGEISGDSVIVSIAGLPPQIDADGSSTALITVKLPTTINDSTAVLLSTDAGVFLPAATQAIQLYAKWNEQDKANQVQVALRSKNVEDTATITVNVAGFEKKLCVPFTRVQPEDLVITPARAAIKAGYADEMIITVTGLRSIGTITSGDQIDLIALDPNGDSIGYFRGYYPFSDTTGKCTFYFSLAYDTLYPVITLRAMSAGIPYKETTIFFQH